MKFLREIVPLVLLGFISLGSVVKCESNCDDNAKLEYEAGKSYVYNAELISYSETARQYDLFSQREYEQLRSGGKIVTSGKVVLTALENCQYVLTLNEVNTLVQGVKEQTTSSGKRYVPRTSLKFTFKNGEVSNLYKSESSQPWTTNIVRGILTSMQNKAISSSDGEPEEKETSIIGECFTHHYVRGEGTFKKRTHFEKCSDSVFSPALEEASSYYTPPYAYNFGQRLQSGHLTCYQSLENGLLSTANCTEYDYIPGLSPREAITKLQLEKSAAEPSAVGGALTEEIGQLSVSTSILYDATRNAPGADDAWKDQIMTSIANLVNSMHNDKTENKADIYLQLKEKAKYVEDFVALEKTLATSGSTDPMQIQFQNNVIRDICTSVGTEPAVLHLTNLIEKNELEFHTTMNFYAKLSLSHEPTVNGIAALATNVDNVWKKFENTTGMDFFNFEEKRRIRMLVLGASGYAHQFCRLVNPACGSVPEYQTLVNGISMFTTSMQADVAIAAFHALGNVEKLTDQAVAFSKKTLTGKTGLTAVFKVGALESFRRDPCQPTLKTVARNMLENPQESEELRLEAYIAVSRCFQEEDLKVIDNILADPQSPISSFIASHVHNILDSQSPSKNYMKESLLAQIGIPESVLSVHNKSHASKYVEFSTFDPSINLGFSADGVIVFKPRNQVPQSARFNVSLDLFGKSINVFQVGLSWRLTPSIGKHPLLSMIPGLVGLDSYYRVFGTTVTMGIDVHAVLKANKFVEKTEDPTTGAFKFELIKAFTLMEHEVTYPTITGLPLSTSLHAAYLPMITVNHVGDSNGLGLWDLMTKWGPTSGSFKHLSTSDSTFILKGQASIGKGTPVHMAETAEFKMHCNHSIAYETIKNMTTMNWQKKIEFPEDIVWSKRVSGDQQFLMEYNGVRLSKWSINRNLQPMETSPQNTFGYELVGLRFRASLLNNPAPVYGGALSWDLVLAVEKANKYLTGYNLDVTIGHPGEHTHVYDLKLSAAGLPIEENLHLNIDYTAVGHLDLVEETDEPKLSLYATVKVTKGDHTKGMKFIHESVGRPKSELNTMHPLSELETPGILGGPTLGLLYRKYYATKVQISSDDKSLNIFESKIQSKDDDGQFTFKFGGLLLTKLGTVKGHLTNKRESNMEAGRGYLWSAEINQESIELGKNRVQFDFENKEGDITITKIVELRGQKHEFIQHITHPVDTNDYNPDTPCKYHSHRETVYKAEYKDGRKHNGVLTLRRDVDEQSTECGRRTRFANVSIIVTSTALQQPATAEISHLTIHEPSPGSLYTGPRPKRNHIYGSVTAFGQKQLGFNFDKNRTVTEDDYSKCQGHMEGSYDQTSQTWKPACMLKTAVAEITAPTRFEFEANFNEVGPYAKSSVYAHDYRLESTANATWTTQRSAKLIQHNMRGSLKNVPKGTTWQKYKNVTINISELEFKIWDKTSRFVQSTGKTSTWKTDINAKFAHNFFNGHSTLNLKHNGPQKTVNIDVANDGRSVPQHFNNTLTVDIDSHGLTRIASPKRRLTWQIVSDGSIPEEFAAKYEQVVRAAGLLKYEAFTMPDSREIFLLKDNFNLYKKVGHESWDSSGKGTLRLEGKNRGAWDWSSKFDILQNTPQPLQIEGPEPITNNEIAPMSPSKPCPSTKLYFKLNGWFCQDLPSVTNCRNHTISETVYQEFAPLDTTMSQDVQFHYSKIDVESGKVMGSVDLHDIKRVHFKSIFDFTNFEDLKLKIDNHTFSQVRDIQVHGPQIKFFLENQNEKNDDKWLIDVAAGVYEEKHQHKFNIRSHSHTRSGPAPIPYTDFNITVSRRR